MIITRHIYPHRRLSLRETFREEMFEGRSPRLFWFKALFNTLFGYDGRACVANFRVASWLHQRGYTKLGKLLMRRIALRFNCSMHAGLQIGLGLRLPHPHGIVFGKYVKIGERCRIYHDVTLGMANGVEWTDGKFPTLGNDITLWAGCRVVGPIVLGNEVQVGANAVVIQSVPEGYVAVGIPAQNRRRKDTVAI